MRQLRRTAVGLVAIGIALAAVAGCAAPQYTYAADTTDHAYFKVPSSWAQVDNRTVSQVQTLLTNSAAGAAGGSFVWSRAYSEANKPGVSALLTGSNKPVVYASVQSLSDDLRSALSFDEMQDLIFPVTDQARQIASEEGQTLDDFSLVSSTTITNKDGVRGINELYEFNVDGQPNAFDQTVLTDPSTTKLYLLLVQCYQSCFVSHEAQIKEIVNSFTVRGS